ncbi:ribosomal protein S1, mitochondrial-like [Mercurialis annua]|uniref:ribosomal protein S1, mitochondrial-like n=1 Tax=Mercurialis annua TaxID=3986 RepID=UPI00215F77C5|nr:ribosomal protein S1, mitochondrial-like [Mercurialis annua]
MSVYMNRLFQRSNSSFHLCSGNALRSEVLRLREDLFLVNAGVGTPKICKQDELIGVPPLSRATSRFENKVGFMGVRTGESLVRGKILERVFIDLVAGDSVFKERATARFNDLVGSTDAVVPGEPLLLLPRKFRQKRAGLELNKIWRTNSKVKGFMIEKVRGGYAVAIAGFIAFVPIRPTMRQRLCSDKYTIETINPKKSEIIVF